MNGPLPSNNLVTLVLVSPYSEGHSFYSDGTSPGSLYAQISVDSPLALSKKGNIEKSPSGLFLNSDMLNILFQNSLVLRQPRLAV